MSFIKLFGIYYLYTLYSKNKKMVNKAKNALSEHLSIKTANASEYKNNSDVSITNYLPDAYVNAEVKVPKTVFGLIAKGMIDNKEYSIYVLTDWNNKDKVKPYITVGEYNNLSNSNKKLYDPEKKNLGYYSYYQVNNLQDYNIKYGTPVYSSLSLDINPKYQSLLSIIKSDKSKETTLSTKKSTDATYISNIKPTTGANNEIIILVSYSHKLKLLKLLKTLGINRYYVYNYEDIMGGRIYHILIIYNGVDIKDKLDKINKSRLVLEAKLNSTIPDVKQVTL